MKKKSLFLIAVICLLLGVTPVITIHSVSAQQPSLVPVQMQTIQAVSSILLLDEEDDHQLYLPILVR